MQKKVDRLEICAVDNYQIFFDGQFVSYGPERTAAGYSRKKVLPCAGVSFVEIKVIAHGVPVYMCDFQLPFFGVEAYNGDELVYTSKDFACRVDLLRDEKTCRYSCQRGFVEKQTLALGAVAMTVECGVRFLTDYLNGDKYFRIHYPDQNLARAKCHLVLARDMIANLDEMKKIVDGYCK